MCGLISGISPAMMVPAPASDAEYDEEDANDDAYDDDDDDYTPQSEGKPLPVAGDKDDWRCSACATQFATLQAFDEHECKGSEKDEGRRTRNKRKGRPVKLPSHHAKMIKVLPLKRKRGRPKKGEAAAYMAAIQAAAMVPEPADGEGDGGGGEADGDELAVVADVTDEAGDTIPELIEMDTPPLKRGRGRPAGRKNKHIKSKIIRKKMKMPKQLFDCEHCGKAFTTESKLKLHTYVHTGERPFT